MSMRAAQAFRLDLGGTVLADSRLSGQRITISPDLTQNDSLNMSPNCPTQFRVPRHRLKNALILVIGTPKRYP